MKILVTYTIITCCQLHIRHKCTSVYEAHVVRVHSQENIILFYKDRVECQQLIFSPGSHGNVHCYPADLEPNKSVKIKLYSF